LCIGAGVCADALPSWPALTRDVLTQSLDVIVDEAAFKSITNTGWGFDALMQAALNAWVARSGTPETFASVVELALYQPLLSAAFDVNLDDAVVTAFTSPHLLRATKFPAVFEFLCRRASTSTSLARVLLAAAGVGQGPRAVITLNYDTILETMIRMLEIDSRSRVAGRHEFPVSAFVRVTGPAAPPKNRIPIIHIHGCVTPRPARIRSARPHDSREALVGPESSYARIAASSSTWAQATFLNYAYSDSIVILGQSLSDPNIRRWLGWSAAVRAGSAARSAAAGSQPLPHIWFRLQPSSSVEERFLEDALTHLGVRIAWLDEWSEAEAVLKNLLALPSN
jgi:hypothetical protein